MPRKIGVICAVFGLLLTVGSSQAFAGWGSHGWSYGSTGGSHGSWGGYTSYASHGSHGSYGSLGVHGNYRPYGHGGMFSRWHYRAAATRYHWFGSWGSHHGLFHHHRHHHAGWGSYGSFGSHGSHGAIVSTCGCNACSSGWVDGGVIQKSVPTQKSPTPAGGVIEQKKPATGDIPEPKNTGISTGNATLTVNVPNDAKVFVNGRETTSKGVQRQFVSRNLEPGFKYTYEIRAEAMRDGELAETVKTVRLTAGESLDLTLNPVVAAKVASTTIKVHVPENAKVYLAGTLTKSVGPLRVFKTNKLKAGESWDDYVIRVETEENGRVVTREKSITLTAGNSLELNFDADETQLAPQVASATP